MPSRLLEPRSSFTEMWLQKPLLDSSSCGWRGPGPSLCGPTSISFVCTRTKHSSLIEDYNCKRACKCTRAYTRRSSVFVAKVGGRRARIRPGLPRTTRLRNISDDSGDSARIAYRRASKAALTRFFCFLFFFSCVFFVYAIEPVSRSRLGLASKTAFHFVVLLYCTAAFFAGAREIALRKHSFIPRPKSGD